MLLGVKANNYQENFVLLLVKLTNKEKIMNPSSKQKRIKTAKQHLRTNLDRPLTDTL